MAKNDNLKKDLLIRRSEDSIYQLFKNIDHSLFHSERGLRLQGHDTINSALIRIFAFRHVHKNFEMLKATITQVAGEVASPKTREELKTLAEDDGQSPDHSDPDASKLIKTMLFLMSEEMERHLKGKGEEEKQRKVSVNIRKWNKIIQIAEKIVSVETREDLNDPDIDVSKLIKVILFLLREEIETYHFKRRKRPSMSGSCKHSGGCDAEDTDTCMDDLSEKPKEKALNKAHSKISLYDLMNETGNEEFASDTNTGVDDLVARLGDKALDNILYSNAFLNGHMEDEDSDEQELASIVPDETIKNNGVREIVLSGSRDSDDLAAKLGDTGLDELIFPKQKARPKKKRDEEDAWMGWID